MGKDEGIKTGHERSTGDLFMEYYNKMLHRNLTFQEKPKPPKPDLIYSEQLGIEVSDVYYDKEDAKLTWNLARKKTNNTIHSDIKIMIYS